VEFARVGFAIHLLHPRSKRPIGDGWSAAPVASAEELRASYRSGDNIGVRLGEPSRVAGGFLHCFDVDVRDAAAATETGEALRSLLPDVDLGTLPTVASGSGGASRHYYFVSDMPLHSRKLWVSGEKVRGADGKWHHTAEIDLFGTGRQVVLPPSIHPDTGKPYVWERPFDLDLIDMGIVPTIPAARLADIIDPHAETYEFESVEPLTFKPGQLEAELDELGLDRIDDRDDWLSLGMALHHQLGGSEEGFQLWMKVSQRGSKYLVKSSERAERQRYRGFGRSRRRPVTMASVRQWILDARRDSYADAFDDLPEPSSAPPLQQIDADVDDLLGGQAPDPLDAAIEDPLDAPMVLPWSSLLDINAETGVIRPHLHNVALMVRHDERFKDLAAFNEFTQTIVQRGRPGTLRRRKSAAKPTLQLEGTSWDLRDSANGDTWTDDKDDAIRAILEAPATQGGYGIKVSDRDLKAAVNIAGRKNPFHPVREYLHGLTWDGVSRVDRLFVDFLGAPDDAYHRSVARIMMIAAVTRVHEPGHKFDSAVILEGVQGKRKSTFISILAKSWFTELDCDITNTQEVVELLQGAWIVEMNELGGFTKADVRHAKAFISRRSDKVRLAYARRAREYHRQSILIGSTNDERYLKDETGGRRFLPVRCEIEGEIDTAALLRDIDQLWAEALQLYRAMRETQPYGTLPLYLADAEARLIAERLQESRLVESTEGIMAAELFAWLETPYQPDPFNEGPTVLRQVTCGKEAWQECLKGEGSFYKNGNAQLVNRALRQVPGWEIGPTIMFAKYGKQRSYRRIYRLKANEAA
jgi:predicted P-loop ATPase